MTAYYPGSTRPFTAKTDLVDHVEADDVNALQEEVVAIENALGPGISISTSPNPASTFVATSTNFANLISRLANLEVGIVSDAHTQYVHNNGGEVITTNANGTTPLVIRAKSGQTVDTFRVESSTGVSWFNVDATGNVFFSGQSLPQGRLSSAKTQATTSPGGAGAETMLTAFPNTFTAVSGRKYRCTLQAVIGDSSHVGSGANLYLHDGSTTGSPLISTAPSITTLIGDSGFLGTAISYVFYMDNLAAGTHTITPSVKSFGAGTLQSLHSSANPGYMWVEDIGT